MQFSLDEGFVNKYREIPVAFGWGGVGELTFYRTYSRDDNPKVAGMETWVDVCERVINGTFSLQKERVPVNHWDEAKAQASAREAFDLMFHMKWTPPGRGLNHMGSQFVHERGQIEALQNCGFISTKYLDVEKGSYFSWFMEKLMLGVGIGFDTRGAGLVKVYTPDRERTTTVVIEDSREGWARSMETLTNSYLNPKSPTVVFDYSQIRPYGQRINGFGGVASGPGPLIQLHEQTRHILDNAQVTLSSRDITDISNLIGTCVVAGNVRRSAEIALGFPTDTDFINLKDYTNPLNAARLAESTGWGWVSNNSVLAYRGMNYSPFAELMHANGEPGFVWMENIHNYGRMNGVPLTTDSAALGVNPCGEQPLGHKEMCTLVEIYLPKIRDKAELKRVIKYAYLYGKTVTLASDAIQDNASRDIMGENRRIGLSLTGITQFVGTRGLDTYVDWIEDAYQWINDYDQIYSSWLGINNSIRKTSIKPSGSVSLVVGVTPGVHFSVSGRYHIRRITVASNHSLVDVALAAGYGVEPSLTDPSSVKIAIPVDAGEGIRAEADVTPEEQLQLAAVTAEKYADNSISITVKFDPNKYGPDKLAKLLEWSETRLKAVSFLPTGDISQYKQAPYEELTVDEYHHLAKKVKPMKIDTSRSLHDADDLYCGTDACEIVAE